MVTRETSAKRQSGTRQRCRARRLRSDQTDAEWKFWYHVRTHRLAGYKFRRQCPIGPYIADFVCLRAMLVVELDGGQHATRRRYDRARDDYLESKGYRVLRFWNSDMLTNADYVLETVLQHLRLRAPSP